MLSAHPGLEGLAVKWCRRAAGQAGVKGGLEFNNCFMPQAITAD